MYKLNRFQFLLFFSCFFYFLFICLFRYFKDFDLSKIFGLNLYRATHWLVNYYDFTFIKRGLVGTTIKFISFNNIITLELILIFSLIILFLFIYLVISIYNIFECINYIKLLFICFIFSHAFIYFYSLDLGRFDQINNILLILAMYVIFNFNFNTNFIYLGLIIFLGTFIHEAFLLIQFPMIISIFFFKEKSIKKNSLTKSSVNTSAIFSFGLIASMVITKFGYVEYYSAFEMKKILIQITNFEPSLGVLETFFHNPLDYLFIGWNTIFCLDQMLCRPYTIITLIINNFPFLLFFIIFFWSISKNYRFKLEDIFLIFCTFIPLLAEIFITFVDYYRVDAITILNLFIFAIIFIKFSDHKSSFLINNINNHFIIYSSLSIFYSLIIISGHLSFNNFSSSVSPINYIIFHFTH
tara:strand:+ start:50 stop:1282 length:1233 start_codon:yes stop_codon:yes gene_type:complete